jgi:DNA processing protein
MAATEETVALIALLRISARPPAHIADDVEASGSAQVALERELSDSAELASEPRLFDPHGAERPEREPEQLRADARRDLDRWEAGGIAVRTVLDPEYPPNLRTAHDGPPLVFIQGSLGVEQEPRAIAVIGSRDPSPAGINLAGDISTRLAALEYVVISGLARGIDTAAHEATLRAGGRTMAVVGTGLHHAYPPENAALQRTIAERGAVISAIWPSAGARREHFPLRNALMSGLARATLIVEAGERSGTRIQARAALAHGRPVLLHEQLLTQPWARELAQRPNVHTIADADQAVALTERLHGTEPLRM